MNWIFNRDRLPALRESKGLTQDAFAEQIGTSKQHVSRWETGDLVPSTATIVKISNKFGVSPSYFFIQSDHNRRGGKPHGDRNEKLSSEER
jgi:transcriptional regulator with XRE-family HTH domain